MTRPLRERVVAAARDSGESVWPMPLPPELRKGLDSAVADIANVPGGGSRDGGMLTAAHFLAEFVPPGPAWAHLDIAGPAWNGGERLRLHAEGWHRVRGANPRRATVELTAG